MTSTTQPEHIREIVHRFSVFYEVYPESTVLHDHTIRQVGFCVDLCGRPPQGINVSPRCARSKEIYRGLSEIARWVIPEEEFECCYELDGFDASLHCGNGAQDRGSVQLEIHILHEHGFDRPLDECELRALREVEDRLKNLGVDRGKAPSVSEKERPSKPCLCW